MKALLLAAAATALMGCTPTKDLARTLRYANNKPVGVDNIRFVDLQKMKRGEACTVNLLYVLPLWGDGSLITAADKGDINTVQLIGETGKWYFPFNTNCTIVYGDKPAVASAPDAGAGS
jgi:hypothetical protein